MMSKLAEWMSRAALELGLRVHIQPTVTLSDGRHVQMTAHFPDLGTPDGIYVAMWEQVDVESQRQLHQNGIPVSLIGEPTERDTFQLDDYVEMFREWGWTATEREPPAWIGDDD